MENRASKGEEIVIEIEITPIKLAALTAIILLAAYVAVNYQNILQIFVKQPIEIRLKKYVYTAGEELHITICYKDEASKALSDKFQVKILNKEGKTIASILLNMEGRKCTTAISQIPSHIASGTYKLIVTLPNSQKPLSQVQIYITKH